MKNLFFTHNRVMRCAAAFISLLFVFMTLPLSVFATPSVPVGDPALTYVSDSQTALPDSFTSTSSLEDGKYYLISNSNSGSGHFLAANGSLVTDTTGTISGGTVTGISQSAIWKCEKIFDNFYLTPSAAEGTKYLRRDSSSLSIVNSYNKRKVSYVSNKLYIDSSSRALTYNNYNGWSAPSSGTGNVYLYSASALVTETESTADFDLTYNTSDVTGTVVDIEAVRNDIIGFAASGSGFPAGVSYTWTAVSDGSINSSNVISNNGLADGQFKIIGEGDALIKVTASFQDTYSNTKTINKYVGLTVSIMEPVISIQGNKNIKIVRNGEASLSGLFIYITYPNGSFETVPITSDMLEDYNNLTLGTKSVGVYYDGVLAGTLNITVVESLIMDDDPDYPNPGSVRIKKSASGSAFLSTGVANVELAVTGVPIKKGFDVILVFDISRSMAGSRIASAKEAAANFSDKLLADNADGTKTLNSVSVVVFAGEDCDYNQGSLPYDDVRTMSLRVNDKSESNSVINSITIASGAATNYDYAFQEAGVVADQINTANTAAGETDRPVYVVFMTDGAPTNYNGVFYESQAADTNYTKSLYIDPLNPSAGLRLYVLDGTDGNGHSVTSTAYDSSIYTNNHNSVKYRKGWEDFFTGSTNGYADLLKTKVTKIISVGYEVTNGSDLVGANSIPPSYNGGSTYVRGASCLQVLQNNSSSAADAYLAENASELYTLFGDIATSIRKAGTVAVVTDTMGDDFSLQTKQNMPLTGQIGVVNPETTQLDPAPAIEIGTYDLYTRADWISSLSGASPMPYDQIGTRKSSLNVLERVTFSADGTQAYSSLIGGGTQNIFAGGIITAVHFIYNSSTKTFTWTIGDITEKEIALKYYIYLDNSTQGTGKEAGLYDTNEHAELVYSNYLGNEVTKLFPVPKLAWAEPQVAFQFYLVDNAGNPVLPDGTIVGFSNRYTVTDEIYREILFNTSQNLFNENFDAASLVPSPYERYDSAANYSITTSSDGLNNHFTITTGAGKPVTTKLYSSLTGGQPDDYFNTKVAFAVTLKKPAAPDAIVIDYGLPADIDVAANDAPDLIPTYVLIDAPFEAGTLENRLYYKSFSSVNAAHMFSYDQNSEFKVEIINPDGGAKPFIRFTPKKALNNTVDFYYISTYFSEGSIRYIYSKVTVVPASTMYYEDNFEGFVIYSGNVSQSYLDEDGNVVDTDILKYITLDGSVYGNQLLIDAWTNYVARIQETNNYSGIDTVHPYGFEATYQGDKIFSYSSQTLLNDNKSDTVGKATFNFTGSGFDIISRTDIDSGMIVVEVYDLNDIIGTDIHGNNKYRRIGLIIKDCYFHAGLIYQIPVINYDCGKYGNYKVVIKSAYVPLPENESRGTVYIDAIRIYNPLDEAGNSYYLDHDEAYPQSFELRDLLLSLNTEDRIGLSGEGSTVYIDTNSAVTSLDQYKMVGPNNELYLAPGQSVSFKIKTDAPPATIQIGAKSINGNKSVLNINGTDAYEIDTATDMNYYLRSSSNSGNVGYVNYTVAGDGVITPGADKYYTTCDITITNTSATGLLALSNIKLTYSARPSYVESLGVVIGTTATPAPDLTFTGCVVKNTIGFAGSIMIVSAPSSSEVEKLKIMSGTTEITPIYTYVGSSGSEKLFIIYLSGNADPATEYTVQGLKAAGGNTYYIGSSVLIGAAVNGENVITAGEWLSAQTDPVKSIFETASAEFAGRYVIRYWR